MKAIELHSGDLRLVLRPDLGGSIAGLWHRGTAVLRSVEPDAMTGPRNGACFPLLPYSNRLAGRRFHWRGRAYMTQANFDASPHSLHGVGWLRSWQIRSQEQAAATLSYRHEPDADWPFAFEAEQRFELSADALRMDLRLTNTDAADQPVGLGWHPYFPRRARSRLQMDLGTRWNHDALQIPTEAVPQAGIDAEVATLNLDHCFGGWSGTARITDEVFSLRLTSTLTFAVVFTPAGAAHFCVEPVSHVNDAIHFDDPAAHGLMALAAGRTAEASMTLQIRAEG